MDDRTICPKCRSALTMKDWTCSHCGAIVDRFLFSTVTLKSLQGEGRNAYLAGYQDCMNQARAGGSPAIRPETYRPSPGQETAYRAGWQGAADKLTAKADRKFGRRRGIRVLWSGVILILVGLGVAYGTEGITSGRFTLIWGTPLGLGVVNIVLGIVMLLTGENDEARPDA
jgi:hypothetical protein